MKKILLIGPMPEPTTGVSLANKVVAENLSKLDDFNVITINTSYNKFDEKLGVFSFAKMIFYLKLNLSFYQIFSNDIVYITPGQTFFGVTKYCLFIILSKLLDKELIIHIHGNYTGTEYNLLKGLKKRIFKSLLSKTTKGIVLSESLTGNMSPFIDNSKIHILYNFVEDYMFTEKRSVENKLVCKKPQIIFLSNLMKEKGLFDLLDAFKALELEGFDYEAKIAGNIDFEQKEIIEAYFKELKNANYVGVVSGETKKELLMWGNIFVLPTYYKMEGQPISILEAMFTGNLILTTQHAGIPDIFVDKINGYYVKKQNPNSIVGKIKEACSEEDFSNEIRMNNYLIATKKFNVNNFINNFIQIIND